MNSQAVDQVLERAVNEGDVPGVVAIAATDEGTIYEGAFGQRELDKNSLMTSDTVFWVASMTKAITAISAMQLVERGELDLDAPAADLLPILEETQVLEGFDKAGAPLLRPPRRRMTLRHLLTHTAGFSYEIWNADIAKYQEITGIPSVTTCANAALMTPLLFDPGERWDYGINMDWVGKMIEAVSGQTLGEYFAEHLFAPLGMESTSFKISSSQRMRLAGMHGRGEDGGLMIMPFEMPQEPEFQMGGGGLYSTAPDYIRFTQMLLNHGTCNGHQVLKPQTVQMMSQNHIGDIDCVELRTVAPPFSNNANFFPDMSQKWGLGFLINTAPTPQGRSAGSLAWAGLANTYYWVDPVKRVTGVFLTQILPFFDHKAITLFRDYETALYKAL